MKTRLALLSPLLVSIAGCGTAGATSPECESGDPIDRAVCAGQRLREAVEESAEDYHHQQQMDPTSSVNAPLWWAVIIIGIGLFMLLKGPSDARRDAGPGHAGAAKAGLVGGGLRWLGAVLIGVGATLIAWRFGGAGGALLAGIPTGLIAMVALGRIKTDDDAIRGHEMAYEAWQREVWEAQNRPTYVYPETPPGFPGGELPPQVVYRTPPPEPQLSHEAAAERYRHAVETKGWNPPEGSALQAVTSIDGKIMPAVQAVSKVSREQKWGQLTTDSDGNQVWDSWLRCTGVTRLDPDARLTLEVTHSRITDAMVRAHLPALLTALRVRSGMLQFDGSVGGFTLTVTNDPDAPPPVAETGTAADDDDDDDWVWRG
ncbi:hypothetical protein C5U48_02805 [Mycolicibacter virginiensis]|uniref:Uncharacterized protein n=1 Tax=Mycolicibacter virginiensis TaxID=1795032 RepID=A0A9X7P037_9MYCO|nr:hypothetical protein [Mycolicibacter virginiensis]PQM53753.1 hypothetical protein C5U48_02805 [Mycolicibacter virginiensis]